MSTDPSLSQFGGRVRLAWAVLRGRQTWPDGYPTPWAYEAAAGALAKRHGQLRSLSTDANLIERCWQAKRRSDIHEALEHAINALKGEES